MSYYIANNNTTVKPVLQYINQQITFYYNLRENNHNFSNKLPVGYKYQDIAFQYLQFS